MNNNLWIDKYRPTNIDNLNTHSSIIDMLHNMKNSGTISNMLCYGPAGCGKTTTMVSFGNDIYKKTAKMNIMNINASDERGINTIREKIINFIQTQSFFKLDDERLPYKMVIMDEADYMTDDAQIAITNIMDEYPDILFIFICNYIYKIHDIIQSRCLTLYFSSIPIYQIKNIISNIAKKENINISKNAIQLLCELADNDMRSALYMLQSLYFSNKRITPTNIYKLHQYPTEFHIQKILDITKSKEILDIYKYIILLLKENGIMLNHIINKLYNNIIIKDNIPSDILKNFIIHFAELENNLTYENTNKIMISNLACGIWLVRDYLE